MNKDELKAYIKEECGDPAVGIGDVHDLSPSEIDALQKTNTIMAQYSPIFNEAAPILQPSEFLENHSP